MADDMHEVVTLLLARMESHPEEFVENTGNGDIISDGMRDRWWRVLTYVEDYGTEEEQKAIQAGLRKVKLDKAHEIMMDELCNGDERRRKFREEQEYEDNLLQQMRQQQVNAQRTITLTQAQMSIVNKLTQNFTPTEKDKFIRDYARNIREKQK